MEQRKFIDLTGPSRGLVLSSFIVSVSFLIVWLVFPSTWREFVAVSMKANTAFSLTLAALAIFIATLQERNPQKALKAIVFVLALIVLAIGAATFFEYVFDISFGIDELLVQDFHNTESTMYPGRMSPIAAFGIFTLGFSLTLLCFRSSVAILLHQASSLFLIFLGLLAMLGYLMGVDSFYKVGPFIRISFYTAACLTVLSLAGLLLKFHSGVMALITSRTPGGMAIRRLLPAAIFLPPLIGWLRLYGQKQGVYGLSQGTSFSVMTYMVLFSFIIYRSGKAINSADEDKIQAEKSFLAELEDRASQLEKAIRTRDEFLSIASHELKTPLTSLKLQVQMQKRMLAKQEPTGERGDEKIRGFFEIAERQVTRLSRLIEDMLDIGRIESGRFRLTLDDFNLSELVAEVAEQMQGEIASSGSELKLHLPAEVNVRADKVRLAQVLMNLLSNSCKYGAGKKIEIFLSEDTSNDQVLLSVQDHGSGIASSDQGRIFERFERAVPGTHISGLGLGLYIVRKIMEQHQGKISVESKLGEGATFTVELPKETQPTPTPTLVEQARTKLDS